MPMSRFLEVNLDSRTLLGCNLMPPFPMKWRYIGTNGYRGQGNFLKTSLFVPSPPLLESQMRWLPDDSLPPCFDCLWWAKTWGEASACPKEHALKEMLHHPTWDPKVVITFAGVQQIGRLQTHPAVVCSGAFELAPNPGNPKNEWCPPCPTLILLLPYSLGSPWNHYRHPC